MRGMLGIRLLSTAAVLLGACGTSAESVRGETPGDSTRAHGGVELGVQAGPASGEEEGVADPMARARAGGWTGASLQPPPHYCNDEGGTEWCEGAHDDDCDGVVDEGCADCVDRACVRFEISAEQMGRGAGRNGVGECVGPVYCGRIDGHATTSPPGGCGDHHCGTVIWPDRTAQPNHCTVYGRCVDGEFVAQGFTW
jgi:hypothetical protein